MTTFPAGRKTHQAVLPQQPALESARADTPGSRDETARGHFAETRGTGRGHGRGETDGSGTPARRRHAEQAENRGGDAPQARTGSGSPRVFVLSKDGLPLMPCHPARARALLARGRAAVARHTPFTIRLKDRRRSDAEVFGVELRIDPGSRGTGLALTETRGQTSADGVTVTVRRGLVAIELRHRGPQIHQAMVRRAGYRRRRRSALRYRPPRFLNRVRRRDWLAPSLRHRVESVCSVVDGLRRYAPVVEIHVEENTFDIPALTEGRRTEAPGGKARARSRSGESCAYCGASDVPLVVDHVRARARGGTDRPANLLLTCVPCNQEKAARPVEEFLARRPELLAAVLGRLRSPLSDAAAMNATRAQLLLRLERTDLPVPLLARIPDLGESRRRGLGEVPHARRPLRGTCGLRHGRRHRPRRQSRVRLRGNGPRFVCPHHSGPLRLSSAGAPSPEAASRLRERRSRAGHCSEGPVGGRLDRAGNGSQYGPTQRRHTPRAVQRVPRAPAPAPARRRVRLRPARRSRIRRVNRLSAPRGVRNV